MKTLEDHLDPDFCRNWKLAEEAAAEARANAPPGDLYFVRAGNAVKIGRTVNVANRLRKMQADNHEELNCILVLPGRGCDEQQWHRRFRLAHIRGEWFAWGLAIETAVEIARTERLAEIAAQKEVA